MREAVVDRDDLAVDQHRIGVLRERRHGDECEAESEGAEHRQTPLQLEQWTIARMADQR